MELPALSPVSPPIPIAPTADVWRAMSPAAQERFLQEAIDALNAAAEAGPMEGLPHSSAKIDISTVLRDFYARIGRQVFVATELPVHYPGEPVFAPDLIAVVGVEDRGHRDPRMGWVVAAEGQGLDLALEILHSGDRNKDLVHNVAWFARLGIPEYIVYDRRHQRLYGYRLGLHGRYTSIPLRGSLLHSEQLGLDMGVVDDRLRFSYGGAQIPESRELVARLNTMLDEREARLAEAEQLAEQAEQARVQAEQDLAQAEQDRAQAEQALVAERARADALAAELAALKARLQGG